jgi:hypothetical protein
VVAGNVAIGASSYMQGVILCKTNIVMVTASALWYILAQTEVALEAQVTTNKVDVEAFYSAGIVYGSCYGYAVLSRVASPPCPTPPSRGISVSAHHCAVTAFMTEDVWWTVRLILAGWEAHGAPAVLGAR